MVIVAIVFDEDKRKTLDILCPELNNCSSWGISELCGGCDSCLLMQAEYYGYPILYVSVGDEQTAKGLSEYLINRKRYRYVV